MSGNSQYGPTNCEVVANFDTCITNAGGSIDPKGWTSCTVLQATDMNGYNNCVLNGYKSIVTCFQSFCNNDTTNTVSTMKAALAQYEGIVNANSQPQAGQQQTQQPQVGQQQTQQPQAGQQQTQQQAGQQTQQPGQQVGQQQNNVSPVQGTNNNNGPSDSDINSGATSNKVTKLFVTFLAISALAMNFL